MTERRPTIRALQPGDVDAAVRMRFALWPDEEYENEHHRAVEEFLAGKPLFGSDYLTAFPRAVFVAESDGDLCGFVEVGTRSHADGCLDGNPVGYVEGWYVASAMRRRGLGRALIEAAEAWARGQGCTEMASDCDAENTVSEQAHSRLGFSPLGRALLFRKSIGTGASPATDRSDREPSL